MIGLRTGFEAPQQRSGIVRETLGVALVASAFSLCLFGDCQTVKASRALGSILGEVGAAIRDAGTQWMVFACAGTYFLAFAVLRRRLAGVGRTGARLDASLPGELWLAGLMAAVSFGYALYYAEAVKSTQALALLGGAMLGQWAALLESRKQKLESGNGAGAIVMALIILLAVAAVRQAEAGHFFQYRGHARWSGPWDNPNTSGVLMGVGMVLAVGGLMSKVQSLKSNAYRALLLAAATVMGVGLLKSYSRGAWLGAVLGLGLLMAQGSGFKAQGSRFNVQG